MLFYIRYCNFYYIYLVGLKFATDFVTFIRPIGINLLYRQFISIIRLIDIVCCLNYDHIRIYHTCLSTASCLWPLFGETPCQWLELRRYDSQHPRQPSVDTSSRITHWPDNLYISKFRLIVGWTSGSRCEPLWLCTRNWRHFPRMRVGVFLV